MVTDTDLSRLGGALDRLGARARKAEREARQLTRQMAELQKLSGASNAGRGGFVDSLGKGLKTAQRDMAGLQQMAETLAGGLNRAFGNAFDRFIVSGKDAKSVLKGLETDLLRLGTKAASRSLQSAITGAAGSGSNALTGLLGGLFSGGTGASLLNLIPGFATGGQFTVGGAGGVDRNLVPLRLTRGERVTVETPAQARRNDGKATAAASVIHMNFNISTPDAASFRMSQSQIQGEALRQAQRALQRNGR